MIIKHRIGMELDRVDVDKEIYVMQDDKYSRELEIHLKANGKKYYPPEDCMVLVRYEKPDGRGGAYDTLPDGRKAAIIEGNMVTIGLAPQVCTAVGRVMLMVTLRHQEKELSCFGICVHVQKGVDSKKIGSERYYHVRGFIPQPHDATVGEYIKVVDVDPQGNITAVTTASEVARDGKSAYQYAQEAGFKGTEAEFSTKLAECGRGIYIGAEAPEGDAVDVWIDIDEEPEEIPAGKDGVVDVTGATVGQTIIVTAVDGNGRPTAWEAVDYQPRTHYALPEKVLADNVKLTTGLVNWISYNIIRDYPTVTVVFDGTTYVCPVTRVDSFTQNGDESYFYIGNYDNRAPEYPFSFFGYIGNNFAAVSPYSGHTYSARANEVLEKIDNKFIDAEWMATMGKVLTTILPQADYTADVATDNSYAWIENYEHPENAALDEMGLFVVGKKYIVSFNGVEYECEAFLYANSQPSDTGDPVGIGNPYVYRTIGNGWPTVDGEPEDNGIPFFITTHDVDGEVWGQVYTTEASTPINVGISRVDEAPSKLPEKFLPDFAMGGTSAPSDWNASEGEAGHIKNRTHWVESGGAAILEETSLPGGDGQFMLEGDITLEDGKTYRIVYNGTEYMCTAVDGATLDPEIPYGQEILFGNYGAMTGAGDTGEPFFGSNVPSMGLMVMDLSGASSCNMGIYDDSEIVHKLDNKFIDAEWMATSKVNKVPVLEEAEYSVTETGAGNSDMGRYAMLSEFSLEGGKKYIVDLDGKSYECTCGVLFEQEITCCYLGNMAFSGAERTNTGEPFCIFIMQELNAYYFFAAEGTHTMGLYKAEEVANKLPEKFLPEMPVIVPVKSIDYETFAVTMSYTGEEVRALLMENKIVFASVMGMTFIATGALVETNEGLKAEFASVLDPTIKARLGPNGEFTVVEE